MKTLGLLYITRNVMIFLWVLSGVLVVSTFDTSLPIYEVLGNPSLWLSSLGLAVAQVCYSDVLEDINQEELCKVEFLGYDSHNKEMDYGRNKAS